MRLYLLVGVTLVLTQSGFSQDFPYRTSFEEPTYTLGTLDGQDGWSEQSATGSGLVQNAQVDGIGLGDQSLQIASESAVSRDILSPVGQALYVDGFYRGPTVTVTPDPGSLTEPGSSILLFHAEEIMALDGDGAGGGVWTDTGVSVPADGLQRITIRQDYGAQTWDLFLDEQPVLMDLGFKNTLDRLSGIDIETSEEGAAFLDDFSVTTAPPDFLADPALFYFQAEWKETGALNWDLSPLDPDGNVRDEDLLELLQRLHNP
jgi:hypothetical protein